MGRTKVMILGITGKYCSGKSVLSRVFVSSGFTLIDVDVIGHEALDAKRDEICSAFGDEIRADAERGKDRGINKKILGNIVFRNKKKRTLLEEIVHPWMVQRVIAMLNTEHSHIARRYVISAALLHKMKLDVLCDVVVLVETHVMIRAYRARRRDGLSFLNIGRRFVSQADIPTRKVLKMSGKTTEIRTIQGVYSIDEYKKKLRKYVNMH